MSKSLEEIRNGLLKDLKFDEKDTEKRSGYIDGVLDMYNSIKQEREAQNG